MLQLPRGIERVDVDQHKTCAQHTGCSDGVLRNIGHHQRDPVATHQTQTLQIGRKHAALRVNLGKGQFLAHKGIRHLVRMLGESFLHQGYQRWVLRWVDIGWNSLWVRTKPRTVTHCFSLRCLIVRSCHCHKKHDRSIL